MLMLSSQRVLTSRGQEFGHSSVYNVASSSALCAKSTGHMTLSDWNNILVLYFSFLFSIWKIVVCEQMYALVTAVFLHLLVFSVYIVRWLNIVSVRGEMATWGLSSLVSVTMSQWLTCRYVNSQLSGSLASQSFNTHNGGNWGKMGTAAKHCGKAGDRWPEKFHCFPFFFNFYDGMVIVGLWNCPMWKSDFVRTVKQRVQLFTAGLRWKCRQQTGKVTMNTLWIFLASNYSLHVCLLPHYF